MVEGAIKAPYFGIIYGSGGIGKSWLASYADDPYFLPLEAGTNLIPAKKFNVKPTDISQVFDMVKWFIRNPTSCKTVIIDSGGFFQSLAYDDVIKEKPTTGGDNPKPVKGIGCYGYHAGYAYAMPYWERLLKGIDILQSKGMNVILITHSQLKNAKTDGGETYKITDFALQSSSNGDVCELLRRRSDWCLFMQSTAKTGKRKGGFGGSTTVAMNGSRPEVIVSTRATSSFFAKVRAIDESKVEDYYEIDPDDIDGSSRKIFEDIT